MLCVFPGGCRLPLRYCCSVLLMLLQKQCVFRSAHCQELWLTSDRNQRMVRSSLQELWRTNNGGSYMMVVGAGTVAACMGFLSGPAQRL